MDVWTGDWLVATSRPQGELVARRFLEMMGGTPYVPMFKKRTCHARRVTEVTTVLFPRYVLLADDGSIPLPDIRSAFGVSDLMRLGDQPATIRGEVVNELRAREVDGLVQLDEDDPVVTRYDYKKGDRMRITDGNMVGFLGKFEKMSGPDRAKVLMSFFGRRTLLDVSLASLERA